MPTRFLIESPVSRGATLILGAERSHYLCKVMRMKPGDTLSCFDGRGTSFSAELLEASNKKCMVQIITLDPTQPPPSHGLHLGMSVLKGQAMDRALQQATELGATEITLIKANRSNAHFQGKSEDKRMRHWLKIVASACEQSGRLFVPGLNPPVDLSTLLGVTTDAPMVFDLQGMPLPQSMPSQGRLLLIGPEGGWDDAERELFVQRGLTCYRLGTHTLRAETSPAVALALVHHLQRNLENLGSV